MVAHAFNPQEAEKSGFVWDQDQPGLHSDVLLGRGELKV